MAVVVSQVVPWTKDQLKLESVEQWKVLGPLVRPSVSTKSVGSSIIVMDKAYASSTFVQVASIVNPSDFTEAFFSESSMVACAICGIGEKVETDDITAALREEQILGDQGLVILQIGSQRSFTTRSSHLGVVTVQDTLELSHLLSLLHITKDTSRNTFQQSADLISHFLESVTTTRSTFQSEKLNGTLAIRQASGLAKFESATNALEVDLKHVLKAFNAPSDAENTYSVHYSDFNGLSQLERHIIASELGKYLSANEIPYFITSSVENNDDDAPRGWAISIVSVPRTLLKPQIKPSNSLAHELATVATPTQVSTPSTIAFSDSGIRQVLINGCSSLIDAEPLITEYDTIVGDGDCGLTLKSGAEKVLSFIKGKDLAEFPKVLGALVDDLEVTMGGTSGALYCIFLSSLSQALQTSASVPEALEKALNHLLNFTRARKGDRTCLDTLIPFVETLKETGDAAKALEEARIGNDGTKNMQARLGRSTYLDDSATRGVPDPGAYGLLVLLQGLVGN